MRSSHSLDRLETAFDDDRLVPDAGLILPATLAHHLGLKQLVDEHLRPGTEARSRQRRRQGPDPGDVGARGRRPHRPRQRPARGWHRTGAGLPGEGGLHPGHLPAQLPLGPRPPARPRSAGSCSARLGRRCGTGRWIRSPSTSTHHRARPTASPSRAPVHHGYSSVRGYHPLLAVAAGTGEVLMARLREARAISGRSAGHFLRETVSRVRHAAPAGSSQCAPTRLLRPRRGGYVRRLNLHITI